MVTFRKRLAEWASIKDSSYLKGSLALAQWAPSVERFRKVAEMTKRPIVIGGCGRSGTTLLLSLLSAHPRIYAIPTETRAFCLAAYGENRTAACVRMGRLYSQLCQADDLSSRTRWCEKTPKNVLHIRDILACLGAGVRFLHIVRDGRDVVTSILPGEPGYWIPPSRWVSDVEAGRRMEWHPQVMAIRYEDLTSDMSGTMHRVCDFLEEPYDAALDRFPESASIKTSRAWGEGRVQRIHQEGVGRWQRKEHEQVVGDLMSRPLARDLLSYYGYIE